MMLNRVEDITGDSCTYCFIY